MIPSYKCICCAKEIKLLYPEHYNKNDDHITSCMWNDGIIDKIAGGYGSKHDTEIFHIALCDECIDVKLKEGLLVFKGNYM